MTSTRAAVPVAWTSPYPTVDSVVTVKYTESTRVARPSNCPWSTSMA